MPVLCRRVKNFIVRCSGLAFTWATNFGYALHPTHRGVVSFDSEQEPKVMETELKEAMTSGVFVEFCDGRGNCVAQTVYLDWQGRPLPAVGDELACGVANAATGRTTRFSGRVRSRQFDVQRDAEGAVNVWVRLVVDVADRTKLARNNSLRYTSAMFSDN
jgi:hypothetical protein